MPVTRAPEFGEEFERMGLGGRRLRNPALTGYIKTGDVERLRPTVKQPGYALGTHRPRHRGRRIDMG